MLNRRILIVALFGVGAIAMIPLAAAAEEVLGQGSFVGKSGHKTSGSVSIVKTDTGVEVRFGSTFKLDGAPGPWLGFGTNGKYDKSSEFTKLSGNSGAQVYKVPGKVNVSKYNEFYVWCRPYGVPLGVARLN
jgi:hypothetical protein